VVTVPAIVWSGVDAMGVVQARAFADVLLAEYELPRS
jgi:hypothetical protein